MGWVAQMVSGRAPLAQINLSNSEYNLSAYNFRQKNFHTAIVDRAWWHELLV